MKPILFNTAMVQAILDGRKTVTRRVVKPQRGKRCRFNLFNAIRRLSGSWFGADYKGRPFIGDYVKQPICEVGDILYVRETWCEVPYEHMHIPVEGGYVTAPKIAYRADSDVDYSGIWRPSIHMPREAARIFLRVTDVKVERLQDITEEQAVNEGVLGYNDWQTAEYKKAVEEARINKTKPPLGYSPKERFIHLWNSTIKPADMPLYGWEANPWVWIYEFERIEKP